MLPVGSLAIFSFVVQVLQAGGRFSFHLDILDAFRVLVEVALQDFSKLCHLFDRFAEILLMAKVSILN